MTKPFQLSPLMFIVAGFALSIFLVIIKGSVDPFLPLGFFIISILEIFFRRQKKIPSNFLSLVLGIILIISIRGYIVDIKNMASNSMEPTIPMNSKVFLVKSFYSVHKNDIIAFRYPGETTFYIARVKNVPEEKVQEKEIGIEVPYNQYFVLPDNRNAVIGMDKPYGLINRSYIVGKVYKLGL